MRTYIFVRMCGPNDICSYQNYFNPLVIAGQFVNFLCLVNTFVQNDSVRVGKKVVVVRGRGVIV